MRSSAHKCWPYVYAALRGYWRATRRAGMTSGAAECSVSLPSARTNEKLAAAGLVSAN